MNSQQILDELRAALADARYEMAVLRDNALNNEEFNVYIDTMMELER